MNEFSSSLNRNLDVTREADVSQHKADRVGCGQLGWYHGNLPPVPFVDGRFLFVLHVGAGSPRPGRDDLAPTQNGGTYAR